MSVRGNHHATAVSCSHVYILATFLLLLWLTKTKSSNVVGIDYGMEMLLTPNISRRRAHTDSDSDMDDE